MNEYMLDIYQTRTGADYHSDQFDKLIVNGEDTNISAESYTLALRQWINTVLEVKTNARAMTSLESVLRNAGYSISFIEQGYEGFQIIRRYKVTEINPLEQRYHLRHEIARCASDIIASALDDQINDLEMARRVEELCEFVMAKTGLYEGRSVVTSGRRITNGVQPLSPELIDKNNSLKRGDMVTHPKFGTGRVFGVAQDGLIVTFEIWGVKRFATDFAPLSLLDSQAVPDALLFHGEQIVAEA